MFKEIQEAVEFLQKNPSVKRMDVHGAKAYWCGPIIRVDIDPAFVGGAIVAKN